LESGKRWGAAKGDAGLSRDYEELACFRENSKLDYTWRSVERNRLRNGKIGNLAELAVQCTLVFSCVNVDICSKYHGGIQSEQKNAQPADAPHIAAIISTHILEVKRSGRYNYNREAFNSDGV
jgi:hypothetical protein